MSRAHTPSFPPSATSAVLLGCLALTPPLLAGDVTVSSVQPGRWADGSTWDAGSPPLVGLDESALVLHPVDVDTSDASASGVTVSGDDFETGMRILEGGVLTTPSMRVGSPAGLGQVIHEAGVVATDFLFIGDAVELGAYIMLPGASLQVASLVDVGDVSGQTSSSTGFLAVTGPATVTIGETLRVAGGSSLAVQPTAPGAAGLTPISTQSVQLFDGATLSVYPEYQAEPGDRWNVLTYSSMLTGGFELEYPTSVYEMVLDTSVPGVVSVIVTDSPYPLPGNRCDLALPVPMVAGTTSIDMAGLDDTGVAIDCLPSEAIEVTSSDIWFAFHNEGGLPRSLRVRAQHADFSEPPFALQVFDGCGGTELACAADTATDGTPLPDPVVEFVVPGGGTRVLRLLSASLGTVEYDIEVEPIGTWTDLGDGLAGAGGVPSLVGAGDLTELSSNSLTLTQAAPSATAGLFLGLDPIAPAPFKGGTLVPVPFLQLTLLSTDPSGAIALPFTWPAGFPFEFSVYVQWAIVDAGAPVGVALSNALRGTTP